MTIQTPNNAAGIMFMEPMLRQFLSYQLNQLSLNVNDPNVTFIDELFGRWGDVVRLQVKKWIVLNPNIQVQINFPRESDSSMPFIAIVSDEENEKTSEAYMSDYGGQMSMGGKGVTKSGSLVTPPNVYGQAEVIPDDRPKAMQVRQLLSVPESHITRLYIGTQDVNETLYLYIIVKALLLVNKMDFDQFVGARNIRMNGSDLQHKVELFPKFAYLKTLTLAYDMNFDVPLSPIGTIGGLNTSLTAAFNGANVSLTT